MIAEIPPLPRVEPRIEAGSRRALMWSAAYVGLTFAVGLVATPANLSQSRAVAVEAWQQAESTVADVMAPPMAIRGDAAPVPPPPLARPVVVKPQPSAVATISPPIEAASPAIMPEASGLAPSSPQADRKIPVTPAEPKIAAVTAPKAVKPEKKPQTSLQAVSGFAVAAGDTAHVRVGDKVIRLEGIVADRAEDKVAALSAILNSHGNALRCEPVKTAYQCKLRQGGADLGETLVRQGFARKAK